VFRHEALYRVGKGVVGLNRLTLVRGEHEFRATHQGKGGYRLDAPGYVPKMVNGRVDAKRPYCPERSISFSAEAVAELGPLGAAVQDISLELRNEVSDLAYLGPLREPPGRSYLWSSVKPGDLGKRGEQAVQALLASVNVRRKNGIGEDAPNWLASKVSEWMKRLGVADELVLERQGKSRNYELIVVRGQQRSNIMDVGFGISQVLPMLVLAHFVTPGTTIVAEQPEIHLHPRAQGGLAELMAEVAKSRKVQFIVETHSEHLFRRLQTLIAEKKLDHDDCRLYFVDRDAKEKAQLTRLVTDKFGRVENWPDDFFGDAIGEVERQTANMFERMKTESPHG
jgi:predicted ATPase